MTNLEIRDAELIMPWRNFSGKPSKFNKEGSRNFAVYLNEDTAEALKAEGWNVKYTNPGSADYESRPYLNVAVGFAFRPPVVAVGTSKNKMRELNEETIGELDWATIEHVDLLIRPRQYEINGNSGVKAYLAEMYVIIQRSSFASEYSNDEDDF